jgi:hypothetical protein
MPQQGHGRYKADADTVREGRTQSASSGGDEGALVPQLSLPPASGPLVLLAPTGAYFVRGRACGCPSQEGATVRGDGNGRRFHFIPGLVIKDPVPLRE